MSARKEPRVTKTTATPVSAVVTPSPKKPRAPRAPRVRLTHFEIKRGEQLRLRIAVADDALADVGDELGTLIKKIAPSTQAPPQTSVVEAPRPYTELRAEDFIVTPQHDDNDVTYHEKLREHLTALFSSLCDSALADALDIARDERARRAEGSN